MATMAAVVFKLSPEPPPPILFSSSNLTFHPSPIPTTLFHRSRFHRHGKNKIPKLSLSASFRNGSNTPSETGCPVPVDQQPINEFQNLSNSFPFSWASGDIVEYCSRLFVTGASFALLVGLPVAWFGSVRPESEPLKPILAGVSSGILVVSLAVVRMYLGWAYVGNRLLSATVEYEETGWYDGQIWVKTAEVLARDRLLGSFSVKPILSRLKYTLLALATSLLICVVLFINVDGAEKGSQMASIAAGNRPIPGVYNDESARSFEPDAFCGEPDFT